MIEEEILAHRINMEDISNDIAKGIAKFAINNGYESLSSKQKHVINGLLYSQCEGDPIHSDCGALLEGKEYLEALDEYVGYDRLMCSECRGQTDHQNHTFDRIAKE